MHDTSGSVRDLSILKQKLNFQLKPFPNEKELLDLSGRNFQMEILASVRTLERFVSKKTTAQWYHQQDRRRLGFVRSIQAGARPTFCHTADFDNNGLLYWLGTNGKTVPDWINPSKVR